MAALVLAATLLLVAQQALGAPAEKPMEKPPGFVLKCMADNGVTIDEYKEFAKSGEASAKLKCNFKCIMQGGGMMSDDGKLNVEPMLKKAPEKAQDAIKQCAESSEKTGGDLCEVAYNHHKCVWGKAPEVFREHFAAHEST